MYNCITCIKMQKGGGWREMISPITHSFRVHFDGLMLFCVLINSTEMCIFQPKIDFQIQTNPTHDIPNFFAPSCKLLHMIFKKYFKFCSFWT